MQESRVSDGTLLRAGSTIKSVTVNEGDRIATTDIDLQDASQGPFSSRQIIANFPAKVGGSTRRKSKVNKHD